MEGSILYKEVQNKPIGYARFEMILDESNKPIDANILEVNPGFEKYFGMKLVDLEGVTKFQLFESFYKGNEDYWLKRYYEVAFEGSEFVEIVPFDEHVSFELSVYSPCEGQFITLFQNVSTRQNNDLLYRDILTNMSDAVFITNLKGEFKFICPSSKTIFRLNDKEIYDLKTIGKLIDLSSEELLKYLTDSKKVIVVKNLERIFISKGGVEKHLLIDIKRFDLRGEELLFACRDVTEQVKISKEKLKEQNKLDSILNTTPDCIYIFNSEGLIVDVNPVSAALSGYSVNELLGKHIGELVISLNPTPAVRELNSKLKIDQSFEFETAHFRKDGNKFPVEVSARFLTLNDELLSLCIVKDITQRKIEENRFHEIIKQAPYGIALVADDGTPYMVNNSLSEMLEYSELELSKMKFSEFTHPDDLEEGLINYEKLLKGEIDSYTVNKRYITKSNTIVHGSLIVCLIDDRYAKDGKRALAMVQDITLKNKQEKDLEEKNRLLAHAQEISQIGSWYLNLTEDKLDWTDEVFRIFDAEPQSFKGTLEAFASFIHPDEKQKVLDYFNECVKERKPYSITHRIITKSKQIKYVEENATFEYDDESNMIKAHGTVQDVTETSEFQNTMRSQIYKLHLALSTGKLVAFEADTLSGELELFRGKSDINPDIFPLEYLDNFDVLLSKIRKEHRKNILRKVDELLKGIVETQICEFQLKKQNDFIWYKAIISLSNEHNRESQKLFIIIKYIEDEKNREEIELAAQEMERLRISRDIHDSIGQMLVGTRLMLKTQKVNDEFGLEDIDEMLDEMIKESRLIINNFGIKIEEGKNFKDSFLELADKMSRIYPGEIKVNWQGSQQLISLKVLTNVFRVYQEALSNAIKYANATRIVVNVESDETFIMSITDNGVGFNTDIANEGFGISNMKARAQSLGAILSIESILGKGTSIKFWMSV